MARFSTATLYKCTVGTELLPCWTKFGISGAILANYNSKQCCSLESKCETERKLGKVNWFQKSKNSIKTHLMIGRSFNEETKKKTNDRIRDLQGGMSKHKGFVYLYCSAYQKTMTLANCPPPY